MNVTELIDVFGAKVVDGMNILDKAVEDFTCSVRYSCQTNFNCANEPVFICNPGVFTCGTGFFCAQGSQFLCW